MLGRTLHVIIWFAGSIAPIHAQPDTLPAPWLDREFRYWQGDPPMRDPSGAEIPGYTDEERRMSFFRDHRFQEIVLEDRGALQSRNWQQGDCAPLQGDTVAVLTGTWSWVNDTLRVIVERTEQYPRDALLQVYTKRDVTRPFFMRMPPTRVCNTERKRRFWFEGDRLAEAVRTWD